MPLSKPAYMFGPLQEVQKQACLSPQLYETVG